MKLDRSRLTLSILVGSAVVLALVSNFRASALNERLAASATPLAVVDWVGVTDKSDEWKELSAQLNDSKTKRQAELAQRSTELNNLREELKVLPENSLTYETKVRELMQAAAMAEAWKTFVQQELEYDNMRAQLEFYQKINAAVESIAARDGWSIIIWDDSERKKVDFKQLQASREMIASRHVMYVNKSLVDITPAVVELLNKQYKFGGAAAAPGG